MKTHPANITLNNLTEALKQSYTTRTLGAGRPGCGVLTSAIFPTILNLQAFILIFAALFSILGRKKEEEQREKVKRINAYQET